MARSISMKLYRMTRGEGKRQGKGARGRPPSLKTLLERFTFEKGETRGGGTVPLGPKGAEKTCFFRETTGRMI